MFGRLPYVVKKAASARFELATPGLGNLVLQFNWNQLVTNNVISQMIFNTKGSLESFHN